MLGGNFFNDLHDDQVLIDLDSIDTVKRGKLELARSDLTMASLKRNSHFEALVLDLLHTFKSGSMGGKRCHVVIAHFLVTGGKLAHNGTSSELKIRTTVVLITGDEENLLLESNIGLKTTSGLSIVTQVLKKTTSVFAHGIVSAKKRSLFVKGHTVVAHKHARNVDNSVTKENGRRGVNRKISTSRVSITKTSIRVRRTVRLSLCERIAIEIEFKLVCVIVEFQHHIVNLSSLSMTETRRCHGLEPMTESVSPVISSPFKNGRRDNIGLLLDPFVIFQDIRRNAVLLQVSISNLPSEHVLSIVLELWNSQGIFGEASNSGERRGTLISELSLHDGSPGVRGEGRSRSEREKE
mmetsp:Transcript_7713/g.12515  ORF Transcript_7713/g.12515 Transcript_7713/m.12515 type:complete len:352 (-) Transcript_7713:31-1086(-)